MAQKRDIYRKVGEPGFNIDTDIDLEYLRRLMETPEPQPKDFNMYGVFIRNIIKIVQNDHHFRGYPDYLKDDMMSEALVDLVKARTKFKSKDYPRPSAPFYYLWRIAFNSCAHVCEHYYRMQNRMYPASQVGQQNRFDDGGPVDDILETERTDWDLIAESLRYSQKEAVEAKIEEGVPS